MEKRIWLGMALLILACLVVSPLIHEFSHIAALSLMHGYYLEEISLYPQVSGSIRILSPLQAHEYILLLATGLGISFLMGTALLHRGRKKACLLSTSSGAGFLLNPAFAMLSKSDMASLLSFAGLQGFSFIIGFIIGLSVIGFCAIELTRAAKSLNPLAP